MRSYGCDALVNVAFLMVPSRGLRLIIEAPIDGSNIGRSVFLSVRVIDEEMSSISYQPSDGFSSGFSLSLENRNRSSIFRTNMHTSAFECMIGESFLIEGANHFYINLFKFENNITSSTPLASSILNLVSHNPNMGAMVNQLINVTGFNATARKHFSYFITGFSRLNKSIVGAASSLYYRDDEFMAKLKNLGPNRVESLSDSDSFCAYMSTSTKIAHCYRDLGSTVNIPFVDYSYISFDGVRDNLLAYESDNTVSATEYLRSLIVVASKLTKSCIIVFSSSANHNIDKDILRAVRATSMSFKFLGEISQDDAPPILHGVGIWIGCAASSSIGTVYDIPFWTPSLISLSAEFSARGDPRAAVPPLGVSEIILQNFDVGRAFIIVSNACFLAKDNFVLLVSDRERVPVIDENFLAEEEDRGFLYTGFRTMHLPPDGPDVALMNTWPRLPGMSSLSFGVQPGHIIHESEPLVQLLFAALSVSCPQCSSDNSTNRRIEDIEYFTTKTMGGDSLCRCNNNDLDLRRKYRYIFSHLRRHVFGTLTEELANDWLLSFSGRIIGFWQQQITLIQEDSEGKGYLQSRRHISITEDFAEIVLSILLRDDVTDAMPDDKGSASSSMPSMPHGVCFEKMLLLGRANSHVKYFGSDNLAEAFKRYVHSSLGISPTGSHSFTREMLNVNPRKTKLKVVFVIRKGPDRIILNMKALLDILRNIGVVDMNYLTAHTRIFEGLSFEEQVKIMVESDVFIGVHGAALMNAIFMRRGSVVIDLLNGPYVEYFFSPPLREAGVKTVYVPIVDPVRQCRQCPIERLGSHCLHYAGLGKSTNQSQNDTGVSPGAQESTFNMEEYDIFAGGNITCLGLRACSVRIDTSLFKAAVMEAYHHVLSAKWAL